MLLSCSRPVLTPIYTYYFYMQLVHALGITGYEGVFRRTCEIVLGELRSNRDTVMCVLDTFVHDPLVEWTGSSKRTAAAKVRR